MNAKQIKNYLLGLNNLRKQLGYYHFYHAVKNELQLQVLDKPQGKKVLILSPHPDDDVFGCGGSLGLYPKSTKISAIYFSDGTRGTKQGQKDQGLKGIRQKEAIKSGKLLNIKEQIFLGLPDGKFSVTKKNTAVLLSYLKKISPDIIYLPFFLDTNTDHQEACRIFYHTCKELKNNIKLYSFEIWNPIFPNRLIDISKKVSEKRLAIRAHCSQIGSRNYEKAIMGLNQYRAEVMGISGYAESFFACDLKIWLKLIKYCQVV